MFLSFLRGGLKIFVCVYVFKYIMYVKMILNYVFKKGFA